LDAPICHLADEKHNECASLYIILHQLTPLSSRIMNWQTVFHSVQSIAKGTRDAPRAIIALRHEVVATTQLTAKEKEEMHLALDGLQGANLYGQIALVGQLKEVLSTHAEWKAQFAEYGIRRELS
jgi:hypothetical protein